MNYVLPVTSLSSIRTWSTPDPRLQRRIEKLRKKTFFKVDDASLAEKVRLSRKDRIAPHDSKELAKSRASVIHSTLLNAATEYVTVIGQAGVTSRHILSLSNPTHAKVLLYVKELSDRLIFKDQARFQNYFSALGRFFMYCEF